MIDFEQWYEQEIGSENKPEYEAAKWAWDFQQAKIDELQRNIAFQEKAIKNIKLQFENKQIDCDRSDRRIDDLQARISKAMKYVSESPLKDVSRRGMINFMDILKGNKDEN